MPPFVGIAGAGAWLLGTWEVDRRSIDDMYHEGAIILLLQIICMVSTLIVYGWICDLFNYVRGNKPDSQVCYSGSVPNSDVKYAPACQK